MTNWEDRYCGIYKYSETAGKEFDVSSEQMSNLISSVLIGQKRTQYPIEVLELTFLDGTIKEITNQRR